MVDARLETMEDDCTIGIVGPVKFEGELVGDVRGGDGLGEIGKQAHIPHQGH